MNDKIKETAIAAAKASGKVLKENFRTKLNVDTKDELSPLVSKADQEAELAMRSVIFDTFPNHIIKGEEHGDVIPEQSQHDTLTWVLDPLDGTTAYLAGLPTFVVLIGVWQGNSPVLGLIYQPLTKDLWVGDKNGTTLNGKKITVNSFPNQPLIMATTSSDYLTGTTKLAFDEIRKKASVTHFGGDGHIYGSLASGLISLIVEDGLKWHDVAALVPIIEGAGGHVCEFSGGRILPNKENYSMIASTTISLSNEFQYILKANGYKP